MAIRSESVRSEISEALVKEPRYKRPFDLAVLVSAHLLLAPLWIALWIFIPLAIKLDDRGPIFYSQERMGRGGRRFKVRKFRSMVVDAEKGTGAVWASRNDRRITRVGRILRHTAMDELPQVLNVFAGDMSFVGPRPERPKLHEQFTAETPDFDKRLQVRPGMAGMAQVYGAYDLLPSAKLVYDLQYIRKMSIFTDAKLLILAGLNTLLGRWGRASGNSLAPTVSTQGAESSLPSNIVPFTPAPDISSPVANEGEEDDLQEAA